MTQWIVWAARSSFKAQMPLQKKHVLITGGSGYLGQFVVQHFAGLGCQVGMSSDEREVAFIVQHRARHEQEETIIPMSAGRLHTLQYSCSLAWRGECQGKVGEDHHLHWSF